MVACWLDRLLPLVETTVSQMLRGSLGSLRTDAWLGLRNQTS